MSELDEVHLMKLLKESIAMEKRNAITEMYLSVFLNI